MDLIDLGYNESYNGFIVSNKLEEFTIGRVIAEHKERYIVRTDTAVYEAEITGNMRFTADSREDFPAVGDWVCLIVCDDSFAVIHKILPRFSMISRQAVGLYGEIQIIACNVDYAFLVQSVDRDFNINRLERYLTICHSSKVRPIIVLTKTDLITDEALKIIIERINNRIIEIPIIAVSNETKIGYERLYAEIEKGKTYCMLGSSGVGKSTITNILSGRELMKTDSISGSTNKGRHVTTHRELHILESGAILIDNPGMRELAIVDDGSGLETTYDKIFSLAERCRFADCTHTNESGCAVIDAVNSGELDSDSYNNYLKMEKEKAYFDSTTADRRKKDKDFGKMLKNYKKDLKKKKF